ALLSHVDRSDDQVSQLARTWAAGLLDRTILAPATTIYPGSAPARTTAHPHSHLFARQVGLLNDVSRFAAAWLAPAHRLQKIDPGPRGEGLRRPGAARAREHLDDPPLHDPPRSEASRVAGPRGIMADGSSTTPLALGYFFDGAADGTPAAAAGG